MEIDSRLEHLSNDEIMEVIDLYEDLDISIAEIVETYKIPLNSSNSLVTILPLKLTEEVCEICGEKLLRNIKRRSSSYASNEKYRKCRGCFHESNSKFNCQCDKCKSDREALRRKKEEEERRKNENKLKIILKVQNEIKKVKYEELSFEEKINLGVLLRYCISEDYSYIKRYEEKEYPMTPYFGRTIEIYKMLTDRNIIMPIPCDEGLKHFSVEEDNENSYSFEMLNLKYIINLDAKKLNLSEIIEKLISPSMKKIDLEYYPYSLELWRAVAKEEVREYLLYTLNEANIKNGKIGEKTEKIIEKLVKNFSISQIYYLIWKVRKDTTSLAYEKRVPGNSLLEILVDKLESYAERTIANGWKTMDFDPQKNLPQSLLSRFVYDYILKIGKDSFYKVPNQEFIDRKHYEAMGYEIPEEFGDEDLILGMKLESLK